MTESKKGISSSSLKLIAMVTMLIDHIGAVILEPLLISGSISAGWDRVYEADQFMRLVIGRAAFPIFCFLLVEGFCRTSDSFKYLLRMFLFALLSEPSFDLALSGTIPEFGYQNVMFTLVVGLLVMQACEYAKSKIPSGWGYTVSSVLILAAGFLLAEFLRTDYGGYGVLCIAVLYHFRKDRRVQIIAGTVAFIAGDFLLNGSLNELLAPLGFLAVAMYDGRKGLKLKYFFYLFYPLHLLVLYGIRCVLS